ncbi:MAG: FeoB-associated Cys-rich membrane protein [Clostridiales bacterium]|nr:FeoB-associated Cys-rich membrane protein [Clostridiales bacterium]
MKWTDIVVPALIALLAWRAVARVRKQSQQGCAGGCSGCAKSGSCPLPQNKPQEPRG